MHVHGILIDEAEELSIFIDQSRNKPSTPKDCRHQHTSSCYLATVFPIIVCSNNYERIHSTRKKAPGTITIPLTLTMLTPTRLRHERMKDNRVIPHTSLSLEVIPFNFVKS